MDELFSFLLTTLQLQMKDMEERMTVSANQEVTMLERLNEYALVLLRP